MFDEISIALFFINLTPEFERAFGKANCRVIDLSCIIRTNGYPTEIFIYISKFHKFHQFLMYRNVATEMSGD